MGWEDAQSTCAGSGRGSGRGGRGLGCKAAGERSNSQHPNIQAYLHGLCCLYQRQVGGFHLVQHAQRGGSQRRQQAPQR